MTGYHEFILQAMLENAGLSGTVRSQAAQLESLRARIDELEYLTACLKDRLLEHDPSMGTLLEHLP